jgi:hypothetical protein
MGITVREGLTAGLERAASFQKLRDVRGVGAIRVQATASTRKLRLGRRSQSPNCRRRAGGKAQLLVAQGGQGVYAGGAAGGDEAGGQGHALQTLAQPVAENQAQDGAIGDALADGVLVGEIPLGGELVKKFRAARASGSAWTTRS